MPYHYNRVDRVCVVCGKGFWVKASQTSRGRGVCCSRDCSRIKQSAPRTALEDRFWAKVDRHGPTPEHRPELGPCWIWMGARNPNGYGRITDARRVWYAHRIAWRLTFGDLADDIEVCHACDGGPIGCIRPYHLFLGTHAENMADMIAKGRGSDGQRAARGEKHRSSKLTWAIVRAARADYAAGGISIHALAVQHGVTDSPMYQAITGKTWKE
jgi:hypothetical protein